MGNRNLTQQSCTVYLDCVLPVVPTRNYLFSFQKLFLDFVSFAVVVRKKISLKDFALSYNPDDEANV